MKEDQIGKNGATLKKKLEKSPLAASFSIGNKIQFMFRQQNHPQGCFLLQVVSLEGMMWNQ